MQEVINTLLNLKLDEEFIISRNMSYWDISQPIIMNNILLRKSVHSYGGVEDKLPFEILQNMSQIEFYTYKEEIIQLGMILFQLLFSKFSYVEIKIPHPKSEIKQLFFYFPKNVRNTNYYGLKIKQEESFESYEYSRTEVTKFPFSSFLSSREIEDKPNFSLCSSDFITNHSSQISAKADQLVISLPSVVGLIEFAKFLMDMGNTHNEQTEVCLENPLFGFGGVDTSSIEACFWLPGSFAFFGADNIDELF